MSTKRTIIPKEYIKFENFIRKCTIQISCPLCDTKMLVTRYQKHCRGQHGLDDLLCCVFCRGTKRWPRGEKTQMGVHLYECACSFVHCNRKLETPLIFSVQSSSNDESNELQFSTETLQENSFTSCPEKCHEFRSSFNDTRSKWNGVHLMEEPLFESEPERLDFTEEDVRRQFNEDVSKDRQKWLALLNPLKFDRQSGLGDFHVWLKRYLYTSWVKRTDRLHYTWYHLSVRAGCMNSFYEAVKELEIVAAPYWCVCDGGVSFENRHLLARTHHRHFILAVKNPTKFKHALKDKVKYEASGDFLEPESKKYHVKLIENANHFARSITYVSRPQCTCKQFFQEEEDGDDFQEEEEDDVPTYPSTVYRIKPSREHYMIAQTMIPHALWWTMLLIPCGGIDKLAQFSIGPRSIFEMSSRELYGKRWTVSAPDEFKLKNCVVRFDPLNLHIDTQHPIEHLEFDSTCDPFVYWFNGKKYPVKLENTPTFHDDEAFQTWHVKNGKNTLLNLCKDCRFYLSRNLQRHANAVDEMKKQCERTMNETVRVIRAGRDKREHELKLEMDLLQKNLNDEKNKNETLRNELDNLHKNTVSGLEENLKLCRGELTSCREKLNNSKCTTCTFLRSKIKVMQQRERRSLMRNK